MVTAAASALRAGGRVLLRRKWLIIVAVIVAVAVAVAVSALSTKVYAATAQVVVDAQSASTGANEATPDDRTNVATHVEVIKSRPVALEVSKQLGAKAQRVSAVRVAAVGRTRVINITIESADRNIAQDAATTYARVYVDQRRATVVNDVQETGRALLQRVQQAQAQLDDLDNRIASPGKTPAELQALHNQRDAIAAQHTLYRQRYEQSVATTPVTKGGVELVQEATTPGDPVRPRPVRNGLLGLILGLLVGAGAAFLFEVVDDKIKSVADLQRHAGGRELLGTVPTVRDWYDADSARLVTREAPGSLVADAYRSLSTSLQFIGMRQPIRTLLVASPMSGEGATTTTANLAVALARSGRRVVCVDCDLRDPRLHAFFGVAATPGFTSVLLGDLPRSASLQAVPIGDAGSLRLLAAGPLPPNPAELLETPRVTELLTAVASDADIVLIDAPAILDEDDALALARRVDGVVLATMAELTKRRQLGRALEELDRAGATTVGLVLNGVAGIDDYAPPEEATPAPAEPEPAVDATTALDLPG